MAGGGASSNASRLRKRVEAETSSSSTALKRAKGGSAFAKCEECHKDVPVALISFHNCSLDAKIKMNLEAQVVEMPSEAKKKPAPERKKAKKTESKPKKEKTAKNSNKPKRPPTAFFVFMNDFRKSFKEANPDCKGVTTVAKEGGEKWKSMTDEEKSVYIERATELKSEYEKALEEYNEAEDEQQDDSSEKEVKEEVEVEDSSEKEVKEEIEEDDE